MTIEKLRKYGLRSRGPTAEDTTMIDMLTEYEEHKDSLNEFKEASDSVDTDAVETMLVAYEDLASKGVVPEERAAEARDANTDMEHALSFIDGEHAEAFVEAYEAVESAWESYVSIKEQDRYDGKTDDVATAWDEITGAIDEFCTAADNLGIE